SGKSTFLRSIASQIGALGGEIARLLIVDGKGEADFLGVAPASSFQLIAGLPQEPLIDRDQAVPAFRWLTEIELPRRREWVRAETTRRGTRVDVRADYVASVRAGRTPEMAPLVIIVDEFAEFMLRGGAEQTAFLEAVQSIAQAGRSVMIHLIVATQRPESKVVPGLIKGNLPTRIALRLPTAASMASLATFPNTRHTSRRAS
ncbi:MAG: FtsK/SpoIIIE domain-containing protein, partial [Desulfobacterales bacterium]